MIIKYLNHAEQLYSLMKGKVVWEQEGVCGYWEIRNNIIFNNACRNVEETSYHIKLISWNWIVLDMKSKSILYFYNW